MPGCPRNRTVLWETPINRLGTGRATIPPVHEPPRPLFIWFIVVVVTMVFAMLYFSLPETIEAVATGGRGSGFHRIQNAKFQGKQVNQRPILVGVWLAIVVPLAAWGVVVTRRDG